MDKPLVVVESPTKVRTIKKYLGKDYNVVATVGHIKDLPAKELGIDLENNFKAKYINIPGKNKVISSLKKSAGDTDIIYLAADPDREGEAIAWHTSEVLKKKGRSFYRVLFHELTKPAILSAMKMPESLNRHKYDSQQARRILDRLVGYQISPLLWRKVKGGLSAGRVQSVAVRIICERERKIHAFDPEEYWTVTAFLENKTPPPFPAKLVKKDDNKLKIATGEQAASIVNDVSGSDFIVDKIVKKTTRRNPQPPFITSKLQQDSIRKLRFSAKKTMMVAQQLYEGIDLGPGEPEGLITYMRTDSTRISKEAANEAIKMINERFGKEYAIDKPRDFKNKKKVQDAHEAIRPTSVYNTPEKLKPFLGKDQLALYTLIWKRFIASQMKQALIDQVSVSIKSGIYTFSSSGSTVKFPGFMALYRSADDEAQKDKDNKNELPELSEGAHLKLNRIEPKQHFTIPPPRFSEASLVKELEENGIGRPSTYAAILSTIRTKGYVDLPAGYFKPTELGFIVNDLLIASFPDVLDVAFTAKLEDDLDLVVSAEMEALDILKRFYGSFEKRLEKAAEEMVSAKGVGLPTGLTCPDCNGELKLKMGKNGAFIACSKYPDCKYSSNFERDEKGNIIPAAPAVDEATDQTCNKCGKPMVIKQGRYGKFIACTGYPECKNTLSVSTEEGGQSTGIKCPEDNCEGEIVRRKSKRGKIFYGCSMFPTCTFATWDKPIDKACPECGAPFVVEKSTKKEGTFFTCLNSACTYKELSED
ncbi:MAG: type I DNA topoisomerase [Desulfobacterales bacterium]|nr:type I DNA topoisomerase [Desulfobacterales bacterium]